jgi:polysaccharide export outer membrane protein
MKRTITFLTIALTFACLTTTNQLQAAEKKAAAQKKVPQADEASYKIGAGDILRIVTWKEPDFTLEDILVRVDGKISFPLLDDIQAAGRTPMSLKNEIQARLKEFVSAPEVTVTVINPGSQKFYILGEVQRTGEYPLVKDLTVLQAFALAGGFTEWASKDEIILLRREDGKRKVFKIDYKDMADGENLEQNVLIKVNDTIIVP